MQWCWHTLAFLCAVHILLQALCKLLVVCRLGASILAGFVSNGPASASHSLLQHHQAGAYPSPRSYCEGPYRSDTLVLVSMVGRQLCGCHASSKDAPMWQKQSLQSHFAAKCFDLTAKHGCCAADHSKTAVSCCRQVWARFLVQWCSCESGHLRSESR